jgi:hypothetical protein
VENTGERDGRTGGGGGGGHKVVDVVVAMERRITEQNAQMQVYIVYWISYAVSENHIRIRSD